MRPTAEKRHNDFKKAIRKRNIDRELDAASIYHHDWYDNLHQYSKNKIHCSCPRCSCKTNNKGKKGNWEHTPNWSISALKQLNAMDYEEEESEEEVE